MFTFATAHITVGQCEIILQSSKDVPSFLVATTYDGRSIALQHTQCMLIITIIRRIRSLTLHESEGKLSKVFLKRKGWRRSIHHLV